eukprot:CAMPEP_0116846558 /NCGR_PEP_ID=MMETSP0418-20121206/13902_1 /TAXON_ID=1158023 /ORGANISM="Astrosyne radiata, Strain 13vi08-1A" /LENGTH=58 /DNA_ID=CAMNT_0004477819 /DNA_START=23 /DNA_END=196 /DNA_ORIENTATION=+
MPDLYKHNENVSQEQQRFYQLTPQDKSEDDFDNYTAQEHTTQELTMSSTLLTSQPLIS